MIIFLSGLFCLIRRSKDQKVKSSVQHTPHRVVECRPADHINTPIWTGWEWETDSQKLTYRNTEISPGRISKGPDAGGKLSPASVPLKSILSPLFSWYVSLPLGDFSSSAFLLSLIWRHWRNCSPWGPYRFLILLSVWERLGVQRFSFKESVYFKSRLAPLAVVQLFQKLS